MAKSLTLEITTSDGQTETVKGLTQFPLTFGRDDSAGVFINDSQCSRVHVAILQAGDGYWLIDEQSTNGTFTENGDKITRVKVGNGSRIRIGKCWVKFVIESPVVEKTEIANVNDRTPVVAPAAPSLAEVGNAATQKLKRLPQTRVDEKFDRWVQALGTFKIAFGGGLLWIAFASGVFASSLTETWVYFFAGWLICLILSGFASFGTLLLTRLAKKDLKYKTLFLTYIPYFAFACFAYELQENTKSLWPESNMAETVVTALTRVTFFLFLLINLRWIAGLGGKKIAGLMIIISVWILAQATNSALNSNPRWETLTRNPAFNVKAKEVPAHFYVSPTQLTDELKLSFDRLEKRTPSDSTL